MKLSTVLLDPGHGTKYQGAASPVWEDGRRLFEHDFTHDLVRRIMYQYDRVVGPHPVQLINLVPEAEGISPAERAGRANRWWDITGGKCALVSIHVNAGGGTGFEVWTSPGQTKSDKLADSWAAFIENAWPEVKFRKDMSDGDADKEANFTVLTKTSCPAILTENLFCDNANDCRLLLSEYFRDKLAEDYARWLHMIHNIEL